MEANMAVPCSVWEWDQPSQVYKGGASKCLKPLHSSGKPGIRSRCHSRAEMFTCPNDKHQKWAKSGLQVQSRLQHFTALAGFRPASSFGLSTLHCEGSGWPLALQLEPPPFCCGVRIGSNRDLNHSFPQTGRLCSCQIHSHCLPT